MTNAKTTRELVYETNRDVKWICRMLQRMEAQDEEFEARIRALEGWRGAEGFDDQRRGRRGRGRGGGGDCEGARRGVRPEKLDEALFHTMFPVHCYTPPEEYVVEGHGVFALPFGPGLPGYSWGHAGCNRRET